MDVGDGVSVAVAVGDGVGVNVGDGVAVDVAVAVSVGVAAAARLCVDGGVTPATSATGPRVVQAARRARLRINRKRIRNYGLRITNYE